MEFFEGSPKVRNCLVALCLLLPCLNPGLDAKDILFEEERLCKGEYLVSENGRFRMGFNEVGALEIVDLAPKPEHAKLVPGWDGKTFWTARFIVDPRNQYKSVTGPRNGREGYLEDWPNRDLTTACCHGDFMHGYKSLGKKKSYQVLGGDYLSLKEGDWHYLAIYAKRTMFATSRPIDIKVWCPPAGYSKSEIVLHLDNCGRAMVLSEQGLHWCSCPFCDDWGEGYRGLLVDFYNFKNTDLGPKGIGPMGMPPHKLPDGAAQKEGEASKSAERVASFSSIFTFLKSQRRKEGQAAQR
jgi:hypothetical protein